MFKMLVVFIFVAMSLNSNIALGKMKDIEKWSCAKRGAHVFVRIFSSGKYAVPCKVFVANDSGIEAENRAEESIQNAGLKRPYFMTESSPRFCKKKLDDFMLKKRKNGWRCEKL